MKKSKILSFLLALAMLMSLVPQVMVSAAGSNVIWEEDFEGEATLASRVDSAAAGAVIEDGVLKTPSEAAVEVNSLSALVEDAPVGKVHVNFDMKAPNVGTAATKAELLTDAGTKVLICYGTWGGLRPHPTDGQYGSAGFDGDVWYNNDFVLDFENNKMYITVTKKSDGTKSLDSLLANKTYKLAISGDIENILGETIGHDYDLSFTTTNGDFKAAIVSLKQGSTVIDDLADITAGDATVTVSFEKTNPGEKTIKVLYAYYNGNKMEDVVVHDIVIGEEEISGTKTDTVTFGTLEGITNVKVMLWEDFLTINPLCAEIDL